MTPRRADLQQIDLRDHLGGMDSREGTARPVTVTGVGVTPEEFDVRFGHVRSRLEAVCTSLVGPTDALDVVHDVYLNARKHVAQLRDPDRIEAWLARSAVNACYSLHRSRQRARVQPYPAAVLDAHGSSDLALRELIERLPPRERTVLVLHYGHGYALDEIGELLDINYATVRSIISRTRQRLYREWSTEP